MNHHIKIDTAYVDAVLSGIKPFEVRRNDRGYQVGDYVIMTEEGDPGDGRHWVAKAEDHDCSRCRVRRYIAARITYVYSGDPRFHWGGQHALNPGWVVLGLGGIDQSFPMDANSRCCCDQTTARLVVCPVHSERRIPPGQHPTPAAQPPGETGAAADGVTG